MTRCECGLSLVRGKLSLMVTRLWCLTGTEVQGYHPHDPALYYLFKIIIKRHKIPPIHNERSIYYSTFLILKNRKPKLSLTIECCLIDCIHGLFKVPSRILHRYGDVTDADLCVALKITPFEGRKFYIRIVAVTRDFGPSSALRQARIAKDLSLLGVSLGPLKLVVYSWCSLINLLDEKTCGKGFDVYGSSNIFKVSTYISRKVLLFDTKEVCSTLSEILTQTFSRGNLG